MIRQYELIDKIQKYNDKANVALINRAYVFSMKAHGNQKRASGEPYLTHPLEVAAIMADMKMDDASICTALLHDTVEDTLATVEEIRDLFGDEIAMLVDGVTKLSRITFNDKTVEQAENFRKLFLAMSKDIRVLLVKLSDRLHNMRTIDHMKKEASKQRVARETLDIFAPLADRIGLYAVKTELEEKAFQVLYPEEHANIIARLDFVRLQDDIIPRICEELREVLTEHNIDCEVNGREKTTYSIYKKMVKKNLTFDQLTDIVAYRVIVKDIPTCYEVLGHIHNMYKAIPGRFKDYISNSKPNGYQSLHTSVIGPYANRIEIQIRTREMHEVAENGIAAHWLYKQKEGKTISPSDEKHPQYAWLRQLIEALQNTDDPQEFLENTKMDLFEDNVFVFSPKGDLISLPHGSTPLDFAYAIHSAVGHNCQSAKVNGRIVPLRTKLQNGDQIEIITGKNQRPSPGWREFVVSAKAKAAINRYLRSLEREEQVQLGREMLEKAARRESYSYNEKDLQKCFGELDVKTLEDLYAAIAQGRLFPRQVFDVLFPQQQQINSTEQEMMNISTIRRRVDDDSVIGIDGLIAGMALHIGRCCNPLPGEPIVGIINTGRGVTIHAKNCRNLDQYDDEPDRWIPVKWNESAVESKNNKAFQARLRVSLAHVPGSLSSFSTAIFNADANIVDLRIDSKNTDSFDIACDVEVQNLAHFERLMSALRNLSCVSTVERVNG
jgi:GTP pyrophosphokinase